MLIKYSFKYALVKVPFTSTVFEMSLFEGRLVLKHAQQIAGCAKAKQKFSNVS